MKELFRCGNIAFVERKGRELYHEIIMYYPNGYYGKQDEYLFDEVHQMYYKQDCPYCFIDPSCFKNEESSYTLAVFEPRKDEDCNVRSIGKRPFEISPADITDFITCVKYGFNYIETQKKSETWE